MHTHHHLNEQMLLAYSAGVLPEAFDLVIASHLYLSSEGRALQCCYNALGGVVLSKCEKERMSRDALSNTLQQIKSSTCGCQLPEICMGVFPEPLQNYVGADPKTIRWRRLCKGVRQAQIKTGPRASARLLYVSAGHAIPDHSRKGTELTLVLQGGYHCGDTVFNRGDIEIADHETGHHPVAEPGQDCICLRATDAPLRAEHWWQRILAGITRQ